MKDSKNQHKVQVESPSGPLMRDIRNLRSPSPTGEGVGPTRWANLGYRTLLPFVSET